MKRKPVRKEKRRIAKTVLRLPDLEVAKSAVLNSLSCPDARCVGTEQTRDRIERALADFVVKRSITA